MDHVTIRASSEHYRAVGDMVRALPGVTNYHDIFSAQLCTFEFDIEDSGPVRNSALLPLIVTEIRCDPKDD